MNCHIVSVGFCYQYLNYSVQYKVCSLGFMHWQVLSVCSVQCTLYIACIVCSAPCIVYSKVYILILNIMLPHDFWIFSLACNEKLLSWCWQCLALPCKHATCLTIDRFLLLFLQYVFSRPGQSHILTHDMWHTTHETWYVKYETRYVGEESLLSKFQLPSSYGLGVKVFWRYFHKGWLTHLIN